MESDCTAAGRESGRAAATGKTHVWGAMCFLGFAGTELPRPILTPVPRSYVYPYVSLFYPYPYPYPYPYRYPYCHPEQGVRVEDSYDASRDLQLGFEKAEGTATPTCPPAQTRPTAGSSSSPGRD